MNKKGFTLIELITIISLLSIVGVILYPKINEAFKTSRADQLESVREDVLDAVDVYLNSKCGKSGYDLLIENDSVKVYLNSISECGLLDSEIYNPVSGDYFNINNEYVIVYIDEVGLIDYELSF